MTTALRSAIVATSAMLASAVGTSHPDCCRLVVSKTSAPCVLNVTVMNAIRPSVMLFEMSPETDFDLDVTTSTGQTVERTALGKSALTRDNVFRKIGHQLQKGERFSEKLDVCRIFKMPSGSYRVSIAKNVIIHSSITVLRTTTTMQIP